LKDRGQCGLFLRTPLCQALFYKAYLLLLNPELLAHTFIRISAFPFAETEDSVDGEALKKNRKSDRGVSTGGEFPDKFIPPERKAVHMSTLTRWNPTGELETIRRQINNTLFGGSLLPGNGEEFFASTEWSPLVDVAEDDKEFTVKAELPGLKKEDVKVTVENGYLRIGGERRMEKEEKTKRYHRIERSYGSFERAFLLPEDAKEDKLTADFENGLLKIHIPKEAKPPAKAIEIKVH